jgi:electron transport complex protein RnfB
MHTVVTRDCTGCELCIPPCPVDCITMIETGAQPTREERRVAAARARTRFERRTARRERDERVRRAAARVTGSKLNQRVVERAIERARRRLAQRSPSEK